MKRKQLTAVLAALAMITGTVGILPSVPGIETVLTAKAGEYNGLEYVDSGNDEIVIIGCDNTLTSVEIPVEIDGQPVIAIDSIAFSGCTELTEIIIPDSVVSIDSGAFHDTAWYNAQPDGVVYAGKVLYAYKGEMPDNTSIIVQEGTLNFANNVFSGCTELTEIIIPDSVTGFGWAAFWGCTGLTEVMIPDSVTFIGTNVFRECTGLTSVTIPDSVIGIGDCAFADCTGLTDITISDSVTIIWGHAFAGCTGLTNITIPDSVTEIGWGAFNGCTSLTDITILNPDCEIDDDEDTIPVAATIHGYENSTAQAYAEANGNPFVSLGEAPVFQPLYGDANDDGEVTIVDVVKLCRCAMGADTLTEAGAVNADVDGNGTADATDASYIIQSLVGLVTLPVAEGRR